MKAKTILEGLLIFMSTFTFCIACGSDDDDTKSSSTKDEGKIYAERVAVSATHRLNALFQYSYKFKYDDKGRMIIAYPSINEIYSKGLYTLNMKGVWPIYVSHFQHS